jgi:hypothetical protein
LYNSKSPELEPEILYQFVAPEPDRELVLVPSKYVYKLAVTILGTTVGVGVGVEVGVALGVGVGVKVGVFDGVGVGVGVPPIA